MSNEEFYDEEIAPALLALRDKCAARNMPFVAVAEWAPNEYGQTTFMPEGARSASMMLVDLASRVEGNADIFIRALLDHGERHGHNSVYLKVLQAMA